MKSLRKFLATLTVCLALGSPAPAAPVRVLYSNDATNLINAPAPGMAEAPVPVRVDTTVAEASGADLHLLQPGNGWVPWWRSEQYPADEHYRRFEERSGRESDLMGTFIRDGGDLVEEFIRACRARGVKAGVSLRLNDYHGSESWDVLRAFARGEHRDAPVPVGLGAMAAQSDVLLERPENQLKRDPAAYTALPWAEKLTYAANPATRITLRTSRVWNWARPNAPAYKLGFVRELCAGYDLDALELDFMRWASFFRLEETPLTERRAIMLAFIKDVRAALDQGAKPGQRRSLGVRVPSRLSGHDPLGVDLPAWVEAGVDWVNLSCHYVSEQQTDLARIHALIPRTPLYLELTFASTGRIYGRSIAMDGARESTGYRLTTAEQLTTAAHLAYARGGYGVSLFNFVYYRKLGAAPHEPPFAVLEKLNDPAWVARQPQHYFLSDSGNPPSRPSIFARNKRLRAGEPRSFELDASPPSGGWTQPGRLRIEAREELGEATIQVRLNGTLLESTADVSELYPTDYRPMAADPRTHRAWIVRPELMRDGINEIEIVARESPQIIELTFIDLALR